MISQIVTHDVVGPDRQIWTSQKHFPTLTLGYLLLATGGWCNDGIPVNGRVGDWLLVVVNVTVLIGGDGGGKDDSKDDEGGNKNVDGC